MLADPRAAALVDNFAAQWLYAAQPGRCQSPTRGCSRISTKALRRSMRRETELFFESIVRENRSVLDFLTAGDTFVNERLARHYGIPNVYGDNFRRVSCRQARGAGCSGTPAS